MGEGVAKSDFPRHCGGKVKRATLSKRGWRSRAGEGLEEV